MCLHQGISKAFTPVQFIYMWLFMLGLYPYGSLINSCNHIKYILLYAWYLIPSRWVFNASIFPSDFITQQYISLPTWSREYWKYLSVFSHISCSVSIFNDAGNVCILVDFFLFQTIVMAIHEYPSGNCLAVIHTLRYCICNCRPSYSESASLHSSFVFKFRSSLRLYRFQ